MSIQTHTLANGLRVVTENMPGLASASVGFWVAAGARHERAEQNGIAHFLEHMAFKGTARRSALQIAEAIEDVGGYINAYTSRETTAYFARVLADDVPLAIDVLSDILMNPAFEAGEIETERGVILQEIGQTLDTPDDVIYDWLQEKAYPEQPIGRSILGPPERVRAFSRSDLAYFMGEHYGPGQLILAAAGAVDHEQICRIAEEAFGSLPANPMAEVAPAQFSGGEVRAVKALEQAHLALAFESIGYRDPEIYTAQVYGAILGGGMSSRLFQEAREKRGLCYSIFALTDAYADTGLVTIGAGTSAEQLPALAELTIDEMRRAMDDITEAEVARARAQMKAGLLMGLESPAARTERLARMTQIWGRIPDLPETVARIDAVTRDGVRDFAARIYNQSGAALALYGPVEGAPDLAALEARRAA